MAYPPNNALKRPYPGPWEAPPRPPKDPMMPSHDPAFYTSTGPNWGESLNQYNYYSAYTNYTPKYDTPTTGNYGDSSTAASVDFTDDYSAFYGKADGSYSTRGNQRGGVQRGGAGVQRGASGFQRGGTNNTRGASGGNSLRGRGGQFVSPNASNQGQQQSEQSRGGGQQKWGSNQNGGRGQQRGRGRGQRGMPPNVFNNPRGRGRGGNKTPNNVVVPPVHTLAKAKLEQLDVENMSVAEKLHRFCLFLRSDDSIKINAIQTIMNAITSSKLRLKATYESEELARVDGKAMYTGVLKLDDVFLARAVRPNKKELKQEVFQKALNVMLSLTVAEIYNLVDPGPDVIREELEKQRQTAEEDMKVKTEAGDATRAEAKSLVGADSESIISQLTQALSTMKTIPDSPISIIEQASTQARTIIKQEYHFETVRLSNSRPYTLGKLTLGQLVIGRGGGSTKKSCKLDTYTKTLDRLMNKPVSELLESVPPEQLPEVSVPSIGVVNKKAAELSLERRFVEMIQKLGTFALRESNINQIDCAAMQNGLTPMVILRNDPKLTDCHTIQCELYMEKIFISSSEGRTKRECVSKAYNSAWEVLTSTSANTLVTDHRRITEEEMNVPNLDIIVKGSGRAVESNMSGLRKFGHNINELDQRSISDLIIVEHSDWSRDRVRNSFCILQSSCNQFGLLMQWETEAVKDSFKCVICIQKKVMGESYGNNKNHARNLAATDALFKLYETCDVITVCPRVDDDKKWISWESISEAADKLKNENVGEEPIIKNDEYGNPLPDTFVMKVISKELENFKKKEQKEELTFGPGIGLAEARELRNLVRDVGLRCDTLQYQGKPYMMIYDKLDWHGLLTVLKEQNKPYGKYMLVKREDLPKHDDIEKNIVRELSVDENQKQNVKVETSEKLS